MHAGVITCTPEASLDQVAAMMAEHRIHCVVVRDSPSTGPHVISDLDLVAAARADRTSARTAGDIAAGPTVAIAADDTLERAAQLMHEYSTSHLLVVESPSGAPVGIISTLDVAEVMADVRVGEFDGVGTWRSSLPPGLRA
jgi:CBS domain-containing protein